MDTIVDRDGADTITDESSFADLNSQLPTTAASDESSFASLNSEPPKANPEEDESSFAALNSEPLRKSDDESSFADLNSEPPTAGPDVATSTSMSFGAFSLGDEDLPEASKSGETDAASFRGTGLSLGGFSLDADPPPARSGGTKPMGSLSLGGDDPEQQRPAVPHPATKRVPMPTSSPPSDDSDVDLPPASEPVDELESVAPIGEPIDEDDGFDLGAIELPSPAEDFDEELAAMAHDTESGDFGPEPEPGKAPVISEKPDNDMMRVPRPEGFAPPPPSSLGTPSAAASSSPELPSLNPASSSVHGASSSSQVGPADSQFSAFSTDMFKLDSVPPSRASKSSQGRPAVRSGEHDDPFFDDDGADDFKTGSSGQQHEGMPAESMAGALPLSGDAEGVEPEEDFSVGGTDYGEVDLGAGSPDSEGFDEADDFGEAASVQGSATAISGSDFAEAEGAEFGAIPQEEDDAPASVGLEMPSAPGPAGVAAGVELVEPGKARPQRKTKKKSKAGRIALVAVLLLAIAGGALALVPSVGPFGVYLASDFLDREKHQALLNQTAEKVLALRHQDNFTAAADIAALCQRSRSQAPRFQPLDAYSAFAHYSWVARFPGQADMQASGKVLMQELLAAGGDESVKYFDHAQAAEALVGGDFPAAGRAIERLGNTVEVFALRGELALREGRVEDAKLAWTAAVERTASAWTLYGLTRSVFKLGDLKAARQHAQNALEQYPKHVGARLTLAEVEFSDTNEEAAMKWIDQLLSEPQLLSPKEVMDAHALLGDIHLDRGRISRAESEYSLALKVDPKAPRPLLGLAMTFSTAGRHAAALARYEAAASEPNAPLEAQLGVVRSHIELERNDKAKQALVPLKKSHSDHPEVSYWFGRLIEGSGKNESALEAYKVAIEKGGESEVAVDATVALAKLMTKMGNLDEAEKLLSDAQLKFPKSVSLRNSLGQVALSQGRYEVALEAFEEARKLDPGDVTSLFNKGSALRRLRRADEAWEVFDEVAKLDKELPGLPLERGLLLEQTGRGQEALAEYEKALAKDPNDPDLKLRVGCSRVAAEQGEAAVEILEEVVKKRSRSSEALHCLGRALFLEGKFMVAIKRLQQAIELDPSRAEYHMYVGWVANDAGQVALAKQSLYDALKLDKGLADAYWQRGRLSLSQGGPGDAILDLRKALKLRPSRYQAHADLAQALYQMGKRQEALREWPLALAEEPENPVWLYRYGKLLQAEHRDADAARQLEKAIKLVEKDEIPPSWLWEAHHLAAASLPAGGRANEHWKKFLELGPPDSPYRRDATDALLEAGEVWRPPGP